MIYFLTLDILFDFRHESAYMMSEYSFFAN
jgi:hypothetical protein